MEILANKILNHKCSALGLVEQVPSLVRRALQELGEVLAFTGYHVGVDLSGASTMNIGVSSSSLEQASPPDVGAGWRESCVPCVETLK